MRILAPSLVALVLLLHFAPVLAQPDLAIPAASVDPRVARELADVRAAFDAPGESAFSRAIRAAEAASLDEATIADPGFATSDALSTPRLPELPLSEAVAGFAAAHGRPVPARVALDLARLPEGEQRAISRLIVAFDAYERATTEALAPLDLDATRAQILQALEPSGMMTFDETATLARLDPALASRMQGVAPALARTLPTRNLVLEAARELAEQPPVVAIACTPIAALPPVLAIGSTCADSYCAPATDFILLIDLGGNDVYCNNAGGNDPTCAGFTAAALIDLGGSDFYTPACTTGVNGGGSLGAGLLLDVSGSDSYFASSIAANGGAALNGVGLLVDGAGDDLYTAGSGGTNGGAWFAGIGGIVDGVGDDTFSADSSGVNGGSGECSMAFLLDGQGNDVRLGNWDGVNGGADDSASPICTLFEPTALLIDLVGDDQYTASGGQATNGGVETRANVAIGVAALVDLQGIDNYNGGLGFSGENGALEGTGFALLLDSGASKGDCYTDSYVFGTVCDPPPFVPKGTGLVAGAMIDV